MHRDNSDSSLLTYRNMFLLVQNLLEKYDNNLSKDHFRLVSNMGERAGQSVFHLHFHLIGDRPLNWPPG